jgi:hypothetical protein
MAIRNLFKSGNPVRSKSEQAADLQVDYSYNQWRHAQMEHLERSYRAACESVDTPATA